MLTGQAYSRGPVFVVPPRKARSRSKIGSGGTIQRLGNGVSAVFRKNGKKKITQNVGITAESSNSEESMSERVYLS